MQRGEVEGAKVDVAEDFEVLQVGFLGFDELKQGSVAAFFCANSGLSAGGELVLDGYIAEATG